MFAINRPLPSLLLPLLTISLLIGCDKKPDDAAKKDDKAAEKAPDKAEPEADAPPPEPEAPKGPMFTAEGVMGDEVSLPIVPFDLTAVELPGYTIQVPEGTEARSKSPSGYTLGNSRVNYSVTITEGEFDLARAKDLYKMLDPEGKIADESDSHIIYERSGTGGFLFQAGVTVGDKPFYCGTVATGMAFTRKQIDQSVASCKTMAAAEGGAAPADPAADAPAKPE
jgi:hypothetical protein